MPHALVPLPDVYESVIRRVAIAMTRQLGAAMRLPEDTPIRLPGNAETIPMNNGTFGPCDNSGIAFPGTSGRLTVRFTEETDDQDTLTTVVNRAEHRPIFHDTDRDVLLTPVYRRVRMVMSFDYKVENITQAHRFVDEMRNRISALRAELYHDVEYHYGIPESIMALLSHLHTLKEESVAPVGEGFDAYLDRYSLRPTTTATTLIGTEGRRVVKEHQHEVLGWFDFTDSPVQPEKEGHEGGTYLASFSYTLHYARPTQLWCRWPMLIHNRPIDRAFRPTEAYSTFKRLPRHVSLTKGNLEQFLHDFTVHGFPYIHHPEIDDWKPRHVPGGRLTLFTGLLVINPDSPRRLINLADMGPFAFTPYFLEYFYQQGKRLFTAGKSIFEFRLYENNRHAGEVSLDLINGTVVIEADRDLDLTKYYHLQISIMRDWSLLDRDTLQCLRRYPTVAYTALYVLGTYLGGGNFEDLTRLGVGSTRLTTENCPGEGSLIGPPEYGGTWPWPWLGPEWDGTTWPGYDWEYAGWPGNTNPDLPSYFPTWPGDVTAPGRGPGSGYDPGGDPSLGGIIRDRDIRDAVSETERKTAVPVDYVAIGNPRVLYVSIMTYKP